MTESSFFSELKKRRVIQVAAIYGVVAWGATEIVVTTVAQLYLPAWVSTLAVILFVAGFPVAMLLSWVFDITADGIQRTSMSSRRGKVSIAGAMVLLIVLTSALFMLIRPDRLAPDPVNTLPQSIAVLPFENIGGISEDNYLIAGISDELRDQLGQIPGIRIAARSSSIAVQQGDADARSMSTSLGVAALIEGSVRRRGSVLRISVHLIEGSSGLAIWNQTFDSGPNELLVAQQSIAERIAERLLPGDESIVAVQSTRSESANELMLLARYREQQIRDQQEVDEETLLEAIQLYRDATTADPASAVAHARLANALMYNGEFNHAEAPIFRALSLDPELSEVQNTLGRYYWLRGINGAGVAFKRAVELNANNADAQSDYAYWLWMQGHMVGPSSHYQRALELDPLSLSRYGALGDYFAHMGNVPAAMAVAERVEQTFDDAPSYRLIARLMELTGRLDESIAWTIKARNLEPGNPEHTESLAELYAEIGDTATALKLSPEPGVGLFYKMRRYQDLIDIGEFLMIDEPNDLELRYLLAFSYVATDQPEAAVRILRSTGLPDTVLGEARQASDIEGFVTLIDALDAIGESALASDLAGWWEARRHTENDNWWILIYRACPLAVSGMDTEALDMLLRAGQSARLPWESLIRDMRCFQRYKDNPQYQQMLVEVAKRRSELRDRLPATLSRHDVYL